MSASWTESIELPAAVNVLALTVIAAAVEAHGESIRERYPDIGDPEWVRIIARAVELSRPPAPAHTERYYKLLARRAAAQAAP